AAYAGLVRHRRAKRALGERPGILQVLLAQGLVGAVGIAVGFQRGLHRRVVADLAPAALVDPAVALLVVLALQVLTQIGIAALRGHVRARQVLAHGGDRGR